MGGISLENLPRPDSPPQIPIIGEKEKVEYTEQSEIAGRVLDGFIERVYQRVAHHLDSGDNEIGSKFGVLECAAQALDYIKMSNQNVERYPTLAKFGRYEIESETGVKIYPEIKDTYKTFLREKLPEVIEAHKNSPELPTLDIGEMITDFIKMNEDRRKTGIDELYNANANTKQIEHDFDKGMKAIIKHLKDELLGKGLPLIRKTIDLYRAIDDTRARDALKSVGNQVADEKQPYIG